MGLSSNNINALVIDDNSDLLKELELLGYNTICTITLDQAEILNRAIGILNVNDVYINLGILHTNTDDRFQYAGIDLLKKLMFQLRAEKWMLLTFEKEYQVFKNNNVQLIKQWKTVHLLDYISFLKQVKRNVK